jgi:hypothetical protein
LDGQLTERILVYGEFVGLEGGTSDVSNQIAFLDGATWEILLHPTHMEDGRN